MIEAGGTRWTVAPRVRRRVDFSRELSVGMQLGGEGREFALAYSGFVCRGEV